MRDPNLDGGAAGADETSPKSRVGMAGKTTVSMLMIGLLPLLVFGGWAFFQQMRALRDDAHRALQGNAAQIASGVDEWLDKNVRALRAAAALPAVGSMSAEEQTDVLATVQRTYPWMYLVFTVGSDGKNVARSDGKPLTDYSDRQYYKDVMGGKDPAWETLIGKTSNKPALVLAVPIQAGGRTVGAMAAAMSIEDISKIVARWRAGHTGHAFLVDEKAKVVAHPRDEFVLQQKYLTDHPLVSAFLHGDGKPLLVAFTDDDGSATLGAAQGNRLGWTVAVQQDEDEVFAPLRWTLIVGIALFVVAAIAVGVAARLSAKRMIRPIVAMTAAADRMSLGELLRPIQIDRQDELGDLAHALERLRRSMKAAMARLQGGPGGGPGASSTRL